MHDRHRRARVASRPRLVRDRGRIVDARRAHPQAVHLLGGARGSRDLALADAALGLAFGTQALALGFLRLAIGFALGLAACALFFLRAADGFLGRFALGELLLALGFLLRLLAGALSFGFLLL